ncbi:MAG: hypothetical protein LBC20_05365 [Planctomycetaceae bacterium]|jgi:hypothetical protein|nr:hypothetical protein [Planctomycetaceae bacterium]
MRFILLSLFIATTFCTANLFAQPKQRSDETKNSFRQLRQTFLQPERGSSAEPQSAEREKSRSVETWVKRNSWRELPVQEQMWLAEAMTGPDQIDKRSFSVRWTGQLNVPANGRYTFSPFTSVGADGVMKLWINDQLILDTNIAVSDDFETISESQPVKNKDAKTAQKEKADTKQRAKPETTPQAPNTILNGSVTLTAGKPADFRLEYVRVSVPIKPGEARLPSYPSAVLAWQSEVIERQVVPSGVFTPPQDLAKEVKQGLKGEYFSDTTFQKRVALRVDPNVDFIWDVGRVVTEHRSTQREIVSETITKLTSPGFLSNLQPSEAKELIQKQLPPLMGVLSASERVVVFKAIGENPNLLQYLTFPQLAGAIRWYAAQTDANLAIDLLVKWSKTSSPPQSQPGFIPGRSPGGYLNLNIEPYFRLARLFLGDEVDQKIKILSDNVTNDDGTCNLTIAYVLACVCRLAGQPKIMADLTDSHLIGEEAEKQPGDLRASWFLAEAFKYETVYSSDFRPGTGIVPIERALEAAESPAMRFRVIAELVARLIALDRSDEARSLIMSVRDQYPDEDQQKQFDTWLAKGDEIKAFYAKIRTEETEAADTFAADQYVLELKRRAVVAEQRGEKRTLDRYQKSIANIEKVQEKKRKEKKEQ